MSKNILVTGGAGFIGSHLVDRLIERGMRVICLDDFSTGSHENISHLLGNELFTFVEADVVQPFEFEVDEIYNFASPATLWKIRADPVQCFKTCVYGAANALDLAHRRGAKILEASTSEVYGDPLVHPQSESYWGNSNPIGERSCYDEGKRAAETLCSDYRDQYKVDARTIRIFNTYGPRMRVDDGRVVSDFIVNALTGKPLKIFGDGDYTRSFCYVDDLVDGALRLMDHNGPHLGPVNIGNPTEYRILDLAKIVLQMTGSSSEIIFAPKRMDDPHRRKPDISLANDSLNWKPVVSLEKGLEKTIDYFAQVLRT